jgi:type IV pilus assembly protein PilW
MRQQRGLSLIELMISITLGLMLMTGVVQMFLSSKSTFTSQQGISRVQETGRLAIDFISQDLRMAGLTGFSSRGRDKEDAKIEDRTLPLSPTNSYTMGVAVLTPAASGIAATANTEVLYIHGALLGSTLRLTQPTDANLMKVPIGPVVASGCTNGSSRQNGLCVDEVLVISDYNKSKVFQPTGIAVNGTDLDISFTGGWGGDDQSTRENDKFPRFAHVSRMARIIYYIANGVSGRPSLFQQVGNALPLELLEGVVNMSITFNREATPNVYAAAVGVIGPLFVNKDRVISVQLELVVQSSEDGLVETPQTYVFKGANVVATDRRLYQVFRSTVALRNRLF